MKKIFFVLLIFSVIFCSGPKPELKLSNPEAFAFDLGDSWEINSSVKSVDFLVNEDNEKFSAKLFYFIDLISPNNDTLTNIYSDSVTVSDNEEIMDIILEAQLEIDSSYGVGDYKMIYHVRDMLSSSKDTISVAFNLSK